MNAAAKVKKAADFLQELSKKFRFGLRTYRPNVEFSIESQKYTVKTVSNGDELEGVLRLRHEVFYREMLNKKKFGGKDVDKYDFLFDHLALIEKSTQKFIGTYRLNCSAFNDKYYTASEFKMENLTNLEGTKLELGRACIHPDFRSGTTIATLWKGLGHYIDIVSADYLFGCSSVKTTDNLTIALIHDYLSKNFMVPEELRAEPKSKFRTDKYYKMLEVIQEKRFEPFRDAAENLVPPLMVAYFKAGGLICGEPAYDKAFKCYDYLTFLDVRKMDETFKRIISRKAK